MSLGQSWAGGMLTMLLTASSGNLLPIQAKPTLLQQLAQVTAGAVTGYLDSNSQAFGDGTYFNVHTFEGTAGDAISLEMISDDFDASLLLIKPGGAILASYDGGGEGTNVKFMLRLPETGYYQLYATSNNLGEGEYRLSLRPLSDAEAAELPSWNQTYYSDRPFDFAFAQDVGSASIQSNSSQGLPMFEEQLAILKTQLGDNHPVVASQLYGLASLYLVQYRFADAEPLLLEALTIYRALPDPYPDETAEILQALADIAGLRGQLEASEALGDQAVEIRENSDLPSRTYDESSLVASIETARSNGQLVDVVGSMDVLADMYNRQGRYDDAESLYQEAIAIRRNSSVYEGIEDPEIARSLNGLALLYQAQGRYKEARSLYQDALDIQEAFNNSIYAGESADIFQLYRTFPILYNLAGVYRATDNISQAVTTLRTALDIEERDLDVNLANLGEADRTRYLAQRANTLDYVLSLNLDAAPESAGATQLALTTLLRRKGRLLEANVRTQEILRENATPEELNWLDQLSQIQQEISNLTLQPPANLSAAAYQTRLAQLKSRANQLETVLARRSADLALNSQSVDLDAVQAKIPANGVLIEYARYQPFDPLTPLSEQGVGFAADRFGAPRYAAYLFFPDGRIHITDLGDAAEIDAAIESFIRLLQVPSVDFQRGTIDVVPNPQASDRITSTLNRLIFAPIAPYLQNTEHLLISPDSQLNRVPFEALQPEAGGDYLVQRYQISYLNSGRDLLQFGVLEPSQNPAVIFANPDYDAVDDTVQIAQARDLNLEKNRRSSDLSQMQVGPLPGTADEAEAIKSLLPNATLLTTDKATENALKQVQSPRILHIATHGFFLPDMERAAAVTELANGPVSNVALTARGSSENRLLRSGLALAGFNPRESGLEDGVLTALEASTLNLFGTQLVVLSACETGLGDIANGEGVYGLRRSFALAGAETQLMSLWQVDDYGTQSLMAQYYKNLTTSMGRSEALREVQLEMIKSDEKYSHPYYWAAFILAGDWRPL